MQKPTHPHGPIALIKIFTIEPEKQPTLLHRLNIMTETAVKKCPGFISAMLHTSFDGIHVTIFARWESEEALLTLLQTPEELEMRKWVKSNGCKIETFMGVAQDPIFAATPQ
jgi:heme-degrading monooxygenase HmoA